MPQTADGPEVDASRPPSERAWTVPAAAASVPRLRHGVGEFVAAHGAQRTVVEAVQLAVTEAATNAVLHGYLDRPAGELVVRAKVGERELRVAVLDDGRGMRPRTDSPGLGLGLPLIAQLTVSVDIRERPGGGTEIRMLFDAPGCGGHAPDRPR